MVMLLVNFIVSSVAPLAGAWIEMIDCQNDTNSLSVAPLAGAWIEMRVIINNISDTRVAPLAGAWIEIIVPHTSMSAENCRSPCGSVD